MMTSRRGDSAGRVTPAPDRTYNHQPASVDLKGLRRAIVSDSGLGPAGSPAESMKFEMSSSFTDHPLSRKVEQPNK